MNSKAGKIKSIFRFQTMKAFNAGGQKQGGIPVQEFCPSLECLHWTGNGSVLRIQLLKYSPSPSPFPPLAPLPPAL